MEGDDDNIGRGVTAQVAEGYGAVVGVFFQQTGEITCHVARLDALADGGSVAADEKLGQFVSRVSFDARGGDAVQKVGIGIGGRHRDVGGFGGNADGESVLGGHDGSRGDEIMKNVGRNCTFGTNAEYHHGIVALRFEAPYPAGIDRLVAAVDELIVGGGPVDCACFSVPKLAKIFWKASELGIC